MAGISKEEKQKREAAKKKVEELLGDIDIKLKDAPSVASKLETLSSKEEEVQVLTSPKTDSWLQKEISRLSDTNKKLEAEIITLKNKPTTTSEDSKVLENKIRGMFNEMRNNFEGNNSTRTPYRQANLKVILEKFLQQFEFLRKR